MPKQESNLTNAGLVDRRCFLTGLSWAAGAAATTHVLRAQERASATARTTHGQVRGAVNDGVNVFKGIPYAGSPAGPNRFKAAPKLQSWTGVRDALAYGPQSIQASGNPSQPAPSDEMCLYLNIWTQGIADKRKRPIMFYSHGGGFATGNGGANIPEQDSFHDGAALAKAYDVVVVTHNHRLSLLGYLYLGKILGEEYASSGCAGSRTERGGAEHQQAE